MCGIAGLIRSEGIRPSDCAAVGRMMAAEIHRGPDASGLRSLGTAVFGHRRLSIIDLSPSGAQPMSNEDGSIWVTFNGELYNYRELRGELLAGGHEFRSQSDTEVILHGYEEWGTGGLLERMRGMFAFGLYDPMRGVVLARDRLGIKPLYYFIDGEKLLFASEVKALAASGLVPNARDPRAIAGFLIAGTVPSPLTILRDVKCLPPGCYLTYQDGRIEIKKYWDLPFEPDGAPISEAEFSGELDDAVSRHLMSDVPLGAFLSGGVDSAAVVAMASRACSSPLRTLTVAFQEREQNEAGEARKFADHFRAEHQEVLIISEDFRRELPKIFAAMDQPTNDGVNTYFVSQAARQAGLTVVLSGLGGDEVFWGYRHHRTVQKAWRWLDHCPRPARRLAGIGAAALGKIRGRDGWMRLAYLSGSPRNGFPAKRFGTSGGLYLSLRGFFPPAQVARLLGIRESAVAETAAEVAGGCVPDGVNGFNYLEFKRYLHDQLLRDADVFSMAHSIELRVPLLDHKVVEYAARLAPAWKLRGAIHKPVLVGAVDDPLLREAAGRPKRGFSFPMDRWMKQYGDELEEMSQHGDWVDRDEARGLWKQFRAGRLHWSRAWALTVLGARN